MWKLSFERFRQRIKYGIINYPLLAIETMKHNFCLLIIVRSRFRTSPSARKLKVMYFMVGVVHSNALFLCIAFFKSSILHGRSRRRRSAEIEQVNAV